MEMQAFYKSVLDQDRAAVVLCDLHDTIIYMNPAAVSQYEKYGGAALLGKNLLDCHNQSSRDAIHRVVAWFSESKENNLVFTGHHEKKNRDVYMVALRDIEGTLIGYYEKHEYRTNETMKAYDMP